MLNKLLPGVIAFLLFAIIMQHQGNVKLKTVITTKDQQLIEQTLKINDLEAARHKKLTVTAYSPRIVETDSTPYETAFMTRVKNWSVAVSWDMIEEGWTPGKKVYIKGFGMFVINDLMADKWHSRIDVFFFDTDHARKFGIKRNVPVVLKEVQPWEKEKPKKVKSVKFAENLSKTSNTNIAVTDVNVGVTGYLRTPAFVAKNAGTKQWTTELEKKMGSGRKVGTRDAVTLNWRFKMLRRGYFKQPDSFMLMEYTCEKCKHVEQIWNSRPRVTPFNVPCSKCDGMMMHTNWQNDIFAPNHEPKEGDRVFIDWSRTAARVEYIKRVEQYWDSEFNSISATYETKEQAVEEVMKQWQFGEPVLETV